MIMLHVVPVSLREANAFVLRHHRHHKPVPGSKFAVGVEDESGLRGVAIAGRPVSRMLDDGLTLEIVRVATDGQANACSMLYGACRAAGKAMGYRKIVTYTLPEEGGASLRAAGFNLDGPAGGGSWSRPSRERTDNHPLQAKLRWSS